MDKNEFVGGKAVEYSRLMKKVEQLAETIENAADESETVYLVAGEIIESFRDELGIYGGRLYHRDGDAYELKATFPDAKEVAKGLRVDASYGPIQAVLQNRIVFMSVGDPGVDPELEKLLEVRSFAAIEVASRNYILAFNVAEGQETDSILYSLGILRYTINQKIRRERMEDVFRQAKIIQTSILPKGVPEYGDFDIHGRSESLESVGGDFYDYIPITEKILGLAVADVSGHGLPAALQVRDIYMGLRMGLSRDFKIVRTVERLNSIIHKSSLSSRFVSSFYGELELNGLFIYVNAGHPAPFHIRKDGGVKRLREGGPVLGPLADATYERGVIELRSGDRLVLFTDGIVEAKSVGDEDEEFGFGRLESLLTSLPSDLDAKGTVDAVFDAVDRFGKDRERDDDRTVVVVCRP